METHTNSYDNIPYRSMPYSQSHPNRLATIATLHGLSPKPLEECRVLELGVAAGGNILPMADQYPNSFFLGIDASGRQIADGQAVIQSLGLTNVELRHQDILDFDTSQKFDYIISHGVYSWVPDEVQQRMLEICGKCLTPGGVAYISYNTFPGWHMRGMIRDIMRYRAKSFQEPGQRLAQARSLLAFLTNSVRSENDPYALLLKQEVETISRAEDSYLHHEHLEDNNAPIYFYEFAERAKAAGLQYLGEAEFAATAMANFPESVQIMLQSVSRDEIELEQYKDFLRNRGFRQTLLCRSDECIDRGNMRSRLSKLRLASPASPEQAVKDLSSSEQTVYTRRNATMTTNNPVVRAALRELKERWPLSIAFPELASIARSSVSGRPAAVDTAMVGTMGEQLGESMMRCFETSLIDLSFAAPMFTLRLSERPVASSYARSQAKTSAQVTNCKHETTLLDDIQRQLLITMDGNHTREQIVDIMTDRIVSGQLVVYHDQRRISEPDESRRIIAENIADFAQTLANLALLIG